jgi:hypothetical protein
MAHGDKGLQNTPMTSLTDKHMKRAGANEEEKGKQNGLPTQHTFCQE